MQDVKEGTIMKDLEPYVIDADSSKIRCIDERPTVESTVNEVHLPGAVYGLIDALKATMGVSEDQAWSMVKRLMFLWTCTPMITIMKCPG